MDQHLLALRTKMETLKDHYDLICARLNPGTSAEGRIAIDIDRHRAKKAWLAAHVEYEKAVSDFCERSTG